MKPVHVVKTSLTEGTYLMNGCTVNNESPQLVLSNSERILKQYDTRRMSHVRDILGHTAPIKDVVANGSMIASIQIDTGVMITDIRMQQPAHFLTELQGEQVEGNTLDISPCGHALAVGAGPGIHVVDTRTWTALNVMAEAHCDDVTKLRFVDDRTIVSGSEDQMINFYDIVVPDKDCLRCAVNSGEVFTKCTVMRDLGFVGGAGSCETAYLFKLPGSLEEDFPPEKTIGRGYNFAQYVVDWVSVDNAPYLILGHNTAFDNDEVASAAAAPQPLSVHRVNPDPSAEYETSFELAPVHSDIVRLALLIDAGRLLTAGEDGTMAVWSTSSDQPAEDESFGSEGACGNGSGSSDGHHAGGRKQASAKFGRPGARKPF